VFTKWRVGGEWGITGAVLRTFWAEWKGSMASRGSVVVVEDGGGKLELELQVWRL